MGTGLGVQGVVIEGGAPRHQEVEVSLFAVDGTLFDQSVVVTLDGVFHDGSEGGGLIGALAKLLNGRNQFHRVVTEADAELLGGVRMLVCHCCWGGSSDSGVGFRQHQQRQGSAFVILCGFLGKGLEGRTSLGFLPLNTEIIALKQQDVAPSA